MEFPKLQKCQDDFDAAVADGTITYKISRLYKEFQQARLDAILEARAAGWSVRQVTEYFDISKQRLEQIENPVARKARKAVALAIKSGKLTRQSCRACGDPKSEAHHEDYNEPLKVVWLCKKHHAMADADRRVRIAALQDH
jgi:DNA-binding transcriptional MerR regulator